jgi:hypothetical protein
MGEGPVTIGELVDVVSGGRTQDSLEDWWTGLGLENFDPARPVTRLEAAVVIDSGLDHFNRQDVGLDGNFKK